MKPESARFVEQANIILARADIMLNAGLKDDKRTDPALRRFLSQSYEFKSIADYFSGPSPVTSAEDAAEAVATAKRFVAHFARLVPAPDLSPRRDTDEMP